MDSGTNVAAIPVCENYPALVDQSQTRIKFECTILSVIILQGAALLSTSENMSG